MAAFGIAQPAPRIAKSESAKNAEGASFLVARGIGFAGVAVLFDAEWMLFLEFVAGTAGPIE